MFSTSFSAQSHLTFKNMPPSIFCVALVSCRGRLKTVIPANSICLSLADQFSLFQSDRRFSRLSSPLLRRMSLPIQTQVQPKSAAKGERCNFRRSDLAKFFSSSSSSSSSQHSQPIGVTAMEAPQQDHAGQADCRGATQLSPADVQKAMNGVPLWKLSPDQKSITRSFVAKNFVEAIKFFNAVAELAEQVGHHPDLHLTEFRCVEVVLSTHLLGALSSVDFLLASKIDKVDVKYSPKWLKENPLPSS